MKIDAEKIIFHFYPEDTPLRQVLLLHCTQVKEKAIQLLSSPQCAALDLDPDVVSCGAMLHDIGICHCHAPEIHCTGTEHYITHGLTGARMLREYARENHLDLEIYARICERHTGAGLTADEIKFQSLPLPCRDFLPETPEEKLICFADKFFSKSGKMQEKSLHKIRRSMEKFGSATLARFDELCNLFLPPQPK